MSSTIRRRQRKPNNEDRIILSCRQTRFLLSFALAIIGVVCAAEDAKRTFANKIPNLKIVRKTVVLSRKFQSMKRLADLPAFVRPLYYSDKGSGVEVLVATYAEKKAMFVLFRGTDEFDDWKTNISLSASKLGPKGREIHSAGKVHEGFNKVFDRGVVDDIVATIKESSKRSYRLVFAGHSKGGAEALLAASYLAGKTFRKRNVTVLGFGAPRVGNQDFYQWVNGLNNLSVWNFVRQDDPVCRLPPTSLGYRSIGHLVQLDDDGAKAYYRHYGDESLGLRGAPSGWNYDICADYSIHFISEYEKYLKKSKRKPHFYYVDGFEKE